MIVLPVLEKLKTDDSLYVKKSVANVLRNASRYNPGFVLDLCNKWVRLNNPNTIWIIKDGLKKLLKTHKNQVSIILNKI